MSEFGTSCQFAATQHLGRFRSEADIALVFAAEAAEESPRAGHGKPAEVRRMKARRAAGVGLRWLRRASAPQAYAGQHQTFSSLNKYAIIPQCRYDLEM